MSLGSFVSAASEFGKAVADVGKSALEGVKEINPVSAVRKEFPSMFERPDSAGAKPSGLEGAKEGSKLETPSASSTENLGMSEKAEAVQQKDIGAASANEVRGLTDVERAKIKAETGWSDAIIDHIGSMEEYKIYKEAGLKEAEIGGKKALIRGDIDWGQVDEKGRTNAQRIEKGLSPLDKDGNSIELHHIGQKADSPLAELTGKEHRCDGNDTILHDKNKATETHGEGNNWNSERQDYWKARAEYNEEVKVNVEHR